jgi:hypothetical protein
MQPTRLRSLRDHAPAGYAPFSSRLYSRPQLYVIQTLHREFGFLRGAFRERVADFVEAVSSIFNVVDDLPFSEVPKFIGAVLVARHEEIGEPLSTQLTLGGTDRAVNVPSGVQMRMAGGGT